MPVIHSPLDDANRLAAADALRVLLADLLALERLGRQCAWSVLGTQSIELRRSLIATADAMRGLQDIIAARASAIDNPLGWLDTDTAVRGPAAGWIDSGTAVYSMINAASVCVIRARDRLNVVSTADPVTAAVLVDVLRTLEEHSFTWQAMGATWITRGQHGS